MRRRRVLSNMMIKWREHPCPRGIQAGLSKLEERAILRLSRFRQAQYNKDSRTSQEQLRTAQTSQVTESTPREKIVKHCLQLDPQVGTHGYVLIRAPTDRGPAVAIDERL